MFLMELFLKPQQLVAQRQVTIGSTLPLAFAKEFLSDRDGLLEGHPAQNFHHESLD